jgi:hypothetical protein
MKVHKSGHGHKDPHITGFGIIWSFMLTPFYPMYTVPESIISIGVLMCTYLQEVGDSIIIVITGQEVMYKIQQHFCGNWFITIQVTNIDNCWITCNGIVSLL